jgi:hypothetical protein
MGPCRERVVRPVNPSEDIEQLKLRSVAAKHKKGSKAQREALRLAQQVCVHRHLGPIMGWGGGGTARRHRKMEEPLSQRASQHTRMRRELRSQFCVRGAAVAAGRCASVCAQVEAGAPLADLVFCLGPAARAEEGLQEKIEKLGGITKARCDQWQCRC